MQKLLTVCVFVLILGLPSSSVFAIQYCKDLLEPGNTGGWETSLKTFDEEVASCPGAHPELDIWINDVPEPLLTAGFWIVFDTSIEIEEVLIYDNSDLPGPWNPGFSSKVAEPDGPGTYFVAVGGWFDPPYTPITPDSDGDIIIGRIIFRKVGAHLNLLTFSTVPDFETVVGESYTDWDPQINPNTITGTEYSCSPCCTYISTDDPTTISPGGTIDFDANSTGFFCNTPTDLIYSDDCVQGDVNPITGLFTAEAIFTAEDCQVCVTDNANTGSCYYSFCNPDAGCCEDVTILRCVEEDGDGICNEEDNCPNTPNEDQLDQYPPGGNGIGDACECEGNFNCDFDQDGTDAATFKPHFGRSEFNDPCDSAFGFPCHGDFDCDGDQDGTDAAKFKSDFGRSSFNDPCPICEQGVEWCNYPLP